uniref:Uncharacterized protein n=1 Tax=Anguilla anguilla TaxID=7936 RepID=A0A0E9RVN9_ANGAN
MASKMKEKKNIDGKKNKNEAVRERHRRIRRLN